MSEIEYTPNLALAKQPTGAREWGTVLNENFDKIDQSFGDFEALPPQQDNTGKYLTTDGTNPSWAELKLTPHIVVEALPAELEEDAFYYISEA